MKAAIDKTAATFGGIDIVVNNASAIQLTPVAQTDMKRFDLMHQINARGTFSCRNMRSRIWRRSANPHILMLSPPLDMQEKWFAPLHRLCDGEIRHEPRRARPRGRAARQGIAVNALWPRTTIATAAIKNLLGGDALMRMSRTPEIMADAAYAHLPEAARASPANS